MRLLPLFLLLAACDGGKAGDDTADGYHPAGYDVSSVHGLDAKLQTEACTDCHGADLTGGDEDVELSCDSCHAADWRTDCTFCHGGTDDTSGAPPEDIRDNTDPSAMSFPAHAAHLQDTSLHVAFDCTTCHVVPTDAMSSGHLFVDDATAGAADVDLSASLSSAGEWNGTGCSNMYCHGSGQGDDGDVAATATIVCGDCHAGPDDGGNGMSGKHRDHMGEGLLCEECHSDTVTGDDVSDITLHVNGEVNVALPDFMEYSGGTCTGECHREDHRDRRWE